MAADAVQRQRHEGKTCRYRQILAVFEGPDVQEAFLEASKSPFGEAVPFPFFSDELSRERRREIRANLRRSMNWPATCSLWGHDEVVLDRIQNIARIQPECSRSVAAADSFLLIWTDFGRYSSKLPYTPSEIAAAVQHFIAEKETKPETRKTRKLFFWFLVFAFWF